MRRDAVVVLCVMAAAPCALAGSPGLIDPTFGVAGHAPAPAADRAGATALALQPDGSLVAAARSGSGAVLVRYLSTGALDPSFGSGGTAVAPVLYDVLVTEPTGEITGLRTGAANAPVFTPPVLGRHLADGSLDSSFGSGGTIAVEFGPVVDGQSRASSLVRQSDGKLVVAGSFSPIAQSELALARFEADGSPDTGFGDGGVVRVTFGSARAEAVSLIQQADGKLMAGGFRAPQFAYSSDFLLARFTTDGTPDGSLLIPSNGGVVRGLALAPDGTLVGVGNRAAGGSSCGPGTQVVFRTDGLVLDPAFGGSGMVEGAVCDLGHVLVQPEGKIVAAGGVRSSHAALVRYLPDGSLDSTFGIDGVVDKTFRFGEAWDFTNLVRLSDGRLSLGLISITSDDEPTTAVVRYFGGTCGDGVVDAGEDCDDDNLVPDDGCDAACCASDTDADGLCDAIDPCPAGAPFTANLKMGLGTTGKLTLKGDLRLPAPIDPLIDPMANGVRIVGTTTKGTVVDFAVPPGAAADPGLPGWKARGAVGRTTYTWDHGDVRAPHFIQQVKIKVLAASGLVRLQMKGLGISDLARDRPPSISLVLDPPFAGGGRCGEARFPGPRPAPSCTFVPDVRLVCR